MGAIDELVEVLSDGQLKSAVLFSLALLLEQIMCLVGPVDVM